MEVLLRADVDGVGKKGDVVEVADGFARNFLVPKGKAIAATEGIARQAEAMRRSRDLRDAQARGAAEEIAKALVPTVITVAAKAGAEGKLFGSVTAADIAQAVEQQTGLELDKRTIDASEHIKEVGPHHVPVKLHADVEFQVTLDVVPA